MICAFATIALGIYPNPLVKAARKAVPVTLTAPTATITAAR